MNSHQLRYWHHSLLHDLLNLNTYCVEEMVVEVDKYITGKLSK